MRLRRIDRQAPEYAAELELRYRVLRAPLGISREEVSWPWDETSLHWIAEDGAEVIGCVLFHPEGARTGRLLQMAVAPARQRSGIGRALVEALERDVRARGFEEVTLHAREDKVRFYERLGYAVHGAPFVEVGLPHRHMRKRL